MLAKPVTKTFTETLTEAKHKVTFKNFAHSVFNIDDEEFDNNQLSVHETLAKYSSKLTMLLDVDGVALEMVVDTGTEMSTIPSLTSL